MEWILGASLTPDTIIAAISAVMQGIQTWISIKDRKRTGEVVNSTFSSELSNRDIMVESRTLQSIIPPEVMATLVGRVNKCWIGFNSALKSDDEYLPSEMDSATEAVKKCVCRELTRIYKLNGSVPEGILRKWWEMYCLSSN